MVVWELIKPPWCLSPDADIVLQVTQNVGKMEHWSQHAWPEHDVQPHELNLGSNWEKTVELPVYGPEDWEETDRL